VAEDMDELRERAQFSEAAALHLQALEDEQATFAGSTVRHGTTSGWRRHQTLGQRPCDPCYQAKQAYDHRYATAGDTQRKRRLGAKAQSLALQRLKAQYPGEYRAYYEEAKRQLEKEAGE
jgi:hypothetical protein